MVLQPDKSDFILAIIKWVESHESRSHWTFIKDSEVKNKHNNKYKKLKNILSIWYFKRKIFLDGRSMKHKSILFSHIVMQQQGVNY